MGALSGPIRDEVLLGIRDVELISFSSATEIFAADSSATWELFAASSCAFLELSAVGSYATGELIAANSSCSICPPKRLWGFGGDVHLRHDLVVTIDPKMGKDRIRGWAKAG